MRQRALDLCIELAKVATALELCRIPRIIGQNRLTGQREKSSPLPVGIWNHAKPTVERAKRFAKRIQKAGIPRRALGRKEALGAPGTIWNYSSGTSNFLSGLLRQQLGNDQDYLNFPYRELIDRIGMYSMLMETDLSGNFVGSSYGWASTRDWGKFGLLYLHRGNWNGAQIFDPAWVDYITRPTDHSDKQYGAHFWLNAGGKYPDAPRDLYSANGYQGQYVFIIPSRNLVVVRTGLAEEPDFDVNAFLGKLVQAFD